MDLEALLSRYVADGHEPAIAELVRRTRPRLLAVARRIGAPQDAEDSVQTAYLSLVRQGAIRAPVLPWLVTAVVRTAYAAKAARARQTALAEKLSRVPRDEALSAVDGAARSEEAELLRRSVDRLPEPYRDAAVLHYFQGLATPEVAELLSVTDAAVRKRLERARLLLRGSLDARLLGAFLAIPWFVEDAASAALGGIAVKKTLSLAGLVMLLCVGAGTVAVLGARSGPETPRAASAERHALEAVQAPAASVATPAPYSGVVVDTAGRPVAGARVEVRKRLRKWGDSFYAGSEDLAAEAELAARSGADGRFSIDAPGEQDALDLHAVADGYGRAVARARPGVETLIVLGEGGWIRVAVRDGAGAAVPGALISLCEGKAPLGRRNRDRHPVLLRQPADWNGEASFALAPGPYAILVRADGLTPWYGDPVAVAEGDAVEVEVGLGRGTIAEILVRDPGGAPVEGAQVEVRGPRESGGRKTTDARGTCTVPGIAAPDKDIDYWETLLWWDVSAKGYALAEGYRRITAEEGTERIEVTLGLGVPVRIRVTDEDGKPLPHVRVNGLHSGSPMQRAFGAETGADGWADLGGFEPAQRRLDLSAYPPYEARSVHVTIGKEPFEQVVTLVRSDGSISGTVLLPDGTLATRGEVGFARDDAPSATAILGLGSPIGRDGAFRIEGAAAGAGHVRARVAGFAVQKFPLTLGPGERREGFVLRLEELGTIRGRLVPRDEPPQPSSPKAPRPRPFVGVEVQLVQDIEYVGGATSVGRVAHTFTGKDGSFLFRGVADEDYRISTRVPEWIMAESLQSVRPSTDEIVVRMKPAAEGHGIRVLLSVPPADDGTPVPGPIEVLYAANGDRRIMTPGKKLDGDLWQFGFHSKPGTYDLEAWCAGFLTCRMPSVAIEDRTDAAPIVARFRRGAVVRLRAFDAGGAPMRGVSVTVGNQQLRTDERGECEVSGLEPRDQELRVNLVGERHTFGTVKLRPPGRADVTIRRHGYAYVRLKGRVYGELREKLVWRLLDADGRLADESVFDVSEVASYGRDRRITGYLKTTVPGLYRVAVEIDGKRAEAPVEISIGEETEVELVPE